MDAATIAGLLADPARLRVVAALALGAGTIEEVDGSTVVGIDWQAEAASRNAALAASMPRLDIRLNTLFPPDPSCLDGLFP